MPAALGFMAAAYFVFRILTEILKGPRRYPAVALYGLAIAFGVIAMCVIIVCAFDLLSISSNGGRL